MINQPTTNPQIERSDKLPSMAPKDIRHTNLWTDRQGRQAFEYLRGDPASPRLSTDQAGTIVVFTECLAGMLKHGYTELKERQKAHERGERETLRFDLAKGHRPLAEYVSPTTLEAAERLGFIEPAVVYDGSTKTRPTQFAHVKLYDLGSKAREYLDMQAVRGIDNEGDTDRSSDTAEKVVHRFMVRVVELTYREKGKGVRTYVPAADVAPSAMERDLEGEVIDVVAYNNGGGIYATCEVETQPVNARDVKADAAAMAPLEGDTDWVVCRQPDVARLLNSLTRAGIELPDGHPGFHPDIATKYNMERLQRDGVRIPRATSPIVSSVNTVDNLRQKLTFEQDRVDFSDGNYESLYSVDPEQQQFEVSEDE